MNIAECRMCGQMREVAASLLDQSLNWTIKYLNVEINSGLPTTICAECLHKLQQWFLCLRKAELLQPVFANIFTLAEMKPTNHQQKDVVHPSSSHQEIRVKIEKSENELEQHHQQHLLGTRRKHHSNKCEVCGKVLGSQPSLITHFKRHTDFRPFDCEICGKKFKFKIDLRNHESGVHTADRPHQCNLCGKAFKMKGHLTEHIKRHSDNYTYECPDCGLKYKTSGDLFRHKEQAHKTDAVYKCWQCGKTCSTKGNLKTHINTHIK